MPMGLRDRSTARPREPPIRPPGLGSHHQAGEHQQQRRPGPKRGRRLRVPRGVRIAKFFIAPAMQVNRAEPSLVPCAAPGFSVRRVVFRFGRHEEGVWFNNRRRLRIAVGCASGVRLSRGVVPDETLVFIPDDLIESCGPHTQGRFGGPEPECDVAVAQLLRPQPKQDQRARKLVC